MEKRGVFNHRFLPYLLLAPQIAITLVFFYWPASQAVWQSFLLQDAFGLSTAFVWFENYRDLFIRPDYYQSILTTLILASAIAFLSLSVALLLVFSFSLSWIWTALGLVLRTPNSVMGVSMMVLFPLTFVSNVFVDPRTMPSWLQSVVGFNPITHLVTAVRVDGAGHVRAWNTDPAAYERRVAEFLECATASGSCG